MKDQVLLVITPFDITANREKFLQALSSDIKNKYDIKFLDGTTQINKLYKTVKCLNKKYHCNVYIYDARYSSADSAKVFQILSKCSYKVFYTNATSNALVEMNDKVKYIRGIKNSTIYKDESYKLAMNITDGDIYSNDMINYARKDNVTNYLNNINKESIKELDEHTFTHFYNPSWVSSTFQGDPIRGEGKPLNISDTILGNLDIKYNERFIQYDNLNENDNLYTLIDFKLSETISYYYHNHNKPHFFNAAGYYSEKPGLFKYDPILTAAKGLNDTI